MTAITLNDLTQATLTGSGVFDVLMQAMRQHLECEFNQNRIKGPDYATVYLGSLTQILQTSVEFLLNKDEAALKAQLVEAQIRLTEAEILKAQAQSALVAQQTLNAIAERDLIVANAEKITAEVALMNSQRLLTDQNRLNAVVEGENLVKQGKLLDAQFNLAYQQMLRTAQEIALTVQKIATEKAQTIEAGVDEGSVIGRQKALYAAQTEGFHRNAEQQAAKIMTDVWSVQRTTDEGISPTPANKLGDDYIGKAVTKLLSGVGAL